MKNIIKQITSQPFKLRMKYLMLLLVALSLLSTNALAVATVNTTTYYHVNLQGTPIAASDKDGNVKWTNTHASYGYHQPNATQLSEEGPTHFGFGGHIEDQYDDKLLVYMQGRYYDPAIGRFLSVDPAGFNETNPASFNRYIYGNNNPHKYVDPDGESPILLLYWGVTGALTAYDTYSAYQAGGTEAAVKQLATDAVLSAVGGRLIGKAYVGVTKGADKLVIGRGKDLAKPGALKLGEFKLEWPSKLPNFRAEWKTNSTLLRQQIGKSKSIRDASPGDKKGLFLNAERNLLQNKGWKFDGVSKLWTPPAK